MPDKDLYSDADTRLQLLIFSSTAAEQAMQLLL